MNRITITKIGFVFCLSLFMGSCFGQSELKDAILDASCTEIFQAYIKPGHVINFESPEPSLDGKFMLLVKNKVIRFVEAEATPRSSSTLSLKKLPGKEEAIALRDSEGQLIAKLKLEDLKKEKVKKISCF